MQSAKCKGIYRSELYSEVITEKFGSCTESVGLSAGAVAGIVIGSIGFVALAAGCLLYHRSKSKTKGQAVTEAPPSTERTTLDEEKTYMEELSVDKP